jgi:hypothetical protein
MLSVSRFLVLGLLLTYSIECSFQINKTSGFNIERRYTIEDNITKIYSSNVERLYTSDGMYVVSKI